MAKNSETSKTFTLLTTLAVLLLVAAGAILYIQPDEGGADAAGAELAALSQAVPLHAGAAIRGDAGGFASLDADLGKIRQLRSGRASGALPGGLASWQTIESQAGVVLAMQADVEAIHSAVSSVDERMPVLLASSNELLAGSGATATIQEFQQRASFLQQNLKLLIDTPDVAPLVTDDALFLRQVTDALAGAETDLDIAPLDADTGLGKRTGIRIFRGRCRRGHDTVESLPADRSARCCAAASRRPLYPARAIGGLRAIIQDSGRTE
jgi:hypothetical protein